MSYNVPNKHRVRTGEFGSGDAIGNNGLFQYEHKDLFYNVIASDEEGWEHISISFANVRRTPTWNEMCFIKDLFWSKDETVIQYHPQESDYVNYHPYCLHLWKPLYESLPVPPSILVGYKDNVMNEAARNKMRRENK